MAANPAESTAVAESCFCLSPNRCFGGLSDYLYSPVRPGPRLVHGGASSVLRVIKREMTSVILPDGSLKEFEGAVSVKDVAKSIGSRLAKDALWGEIDKQPVELDFALTDAAAPLVRRML